MAPPEKNTLSKTKIKNKINYLFYVTFKQVKEKIEQIKKTLFVSKVE